MGHLQVLNKLESCWHFTEYCCCHVQNHVEELDMLQGGSEVRVRARTHCQHFKWAYLECCKMQISLNGLQCGLEPLDDHQFWFLSFCDISKYLVCVLCWNEKKVKSCNFLKEKHFCLLSWKQTKKNWRILCRSEQC